MVELEVAGAVVVVAVTDVEVDRAGAVVEVDVEAAGEAVQDESRATARAAHSTLGADARLWRVPPTTACLVLVRYACGRPAYTDAEQESG